MKQLGSCWDKNEHVLWHLHLEAEKVERTCCYRTRNMWGVFWGNAAWEIYLEVFTTQEITAQWSQLGQTKSCVLQIKGYSKSRSPLMTHKTPEPLTTQHRKIITTNIVMTTPFHRDDLDSERSQAYLGHRRNTSLHLLMRLSVHSVWSWNGCYTR